MPADTVQIGWLIAAMLFTIPQLMIGILVTLLTRDGDEYLGLLERIGRHVDLARYLGAMALILAVVLTWRYAVQYGKSGDWYLLASASTILVIGIYISLMSLIRTILTVRVRIIVEE